MTLQKTCKRCGEVFQCGICPACSKQETTPADPSDLKEGEDFYREGAKVIFTKEYHLKRGYCCKSSQAGCRHCPYRS